MNLYFLLSFTLLAALLFFPVCKLIWVVSVRRFQKTHNEFSKTELNAQLNRARFIALFLVLVFSYLFNLSLGLRP